MSNPSGQPDNSWPVYGQQGGQGAPTPPESPWPVYGQAPQQGQSVPPQPPYGQQHTPYGQQPPQYGQQAPYGHVPPAPGQPGSPYGPQGYPTSGSPYGAANTAPHGPLPSRTGAIWTVVVGAILMAVAAPLTFFAIFFSGLDITSMANESIQATNGGTVVVDQTGAVGVVPSTGTQGVSCTVENDTSGPVRMTPELDSELFVARGLEPGEYTLACDNVPSSATIVVISGSTMEHILPKTMMAFGWASAVGGLGLVTLIGGIVWLVNRNSARRAVILGR